MTNKVNILAGDMGNVINQSNNNPDYGYVRLQQDRVTFGNNGWVKRTNLTALLQGKVEDLQALSLEENTTIPGKIVVKEQLEPFNTVNPDSDVKYAGQTGIICCVDGQPIYRKTFFVSDTSAEDVLIAHDNGQAIREANATASPKIDRAITPEEFNGTPETTETVDTAEEVEETEEVEELEMEVESFEL